MIYNTGGIRGIQLERTRLSYIQHKMLRLSSPNARHHTQAEAKFHERRDLGILEKFSGRYLYIYYIHPELRIADCRSRLRKGVRLL